MTERMIFLTRKPGLSLATIARECSQAAGIALADLYSPSRFAKVVWPRQVAMAMSVKLAGAPKAMVGRHYRCDHTTVIHAMRRVRQRCEAMPDYAIAVWDMQQHLAGLRIYGPPTFEQMVRLKLSPKPAIGFRPASQRRKHGAALAKAFREQGAAHEPA